MQDGKIEQFDTPKNIICSPRTEFIKKLLATVQAEKKLLERLSMITNWLNFHERLITAFLQHLQLVSVSLALALLVTSLLIFLFSTKPNGLISLIYFFSALYSVPSYAFFALLIPVTGLGTISAIIVLCTYSEYILLRAFTTGIKQIDPLLIEAARGMGMTEKQVFKKIQLPLANQIHCK